MISAAEARLFGDVTVEFSTALAQVRVLLDTVGVDDHTTTTALTALTDDFQRSVVSFLGLQLTLTRHGHPLTLTAFSSTVQPGDITTSLRFPLPLLGLHETDQGSSVTFYAGTPDAFVDFVADLSFALEGSNLIDGPGAALADFRTAISLDDPIHPTTITSGLNGVTELSTIRRAMEVLIDDGHLPDDAHTELGRQATLAGTTILAHATHLIGAQPTPQSVHQGAGTRKNGTGQLMESSDASESSRLEMSSRHQQFEAARASADLTVEQLWVRYTARGGVLGTIDIDAYLAGLTQIPHEQRDVLACALNERLADLHHPTRLTYLDAPPAWLNGNAGQ